MSKWLTRTRCEAAQSRSLSERLQLATRDAVQEHVLPSFRERSTLFTYFDRIIQDQRQREEYRRSMRG